MGSIKKFNGKTLLHFFDSQMGRLYAATVLFLLTITISLSSFVVVVEVTNFSKAISEKVIEFFREIRNLLADLTLLKGKKLVKQIGMVTVK